ncbi:transferase [Spinellus fusiger]|nr:transferase [Spinellus fusiger]
MIPVPKTLVLDRLLISPSTPTPPERRRVLLSDWDIVMFKSYTPLLIFYQNTHKKENFMDTQTMIHGLSDVLVDYYPLAGRLLDIGHGRDAIDCTDAGVLFQEATYDGPLEIHKERGYLPSEIDYHHMFPVHFYRDTTDPLLAIQLTRFNDGGVALGIMMLHKVADAYSTCLFLDAWAKITRQTEYKKATFQRNLVVCPKNTVVTEDGLSIYREEHSIPNDPSVLRFKPMIRDGKYTGEVPPPLKSIVIEFHTDGLQLCKRDAHTQEMIQSKRWVSTKDALFAMLFRAIVRSREVAPDKEVKWITSVNGRSRMKNQKEMEQYFGNWMITRTVSMTKGSLETSSLVETACLFRKAMGSLKVSLFHELSQLYTLHEDMTVHYLTYQPNTTSRHTVSDVSMLPFWRLDFGDGNPDRIRSYITYGGNGCMILFGRGEDSKAPSYDIQLQMDEPSMWRFIKDADILKYSHSIIY